MLLWPLYFTSFLIDDFLDDEDLRRHGRGALWRSSRTSSALAYLLDKRDGVEGGWADLAKWNVEFTESLGVYDRVVPYEDIDEPADQRPSTWTCPATQGSEAPSTAHWGDGLKHSAAVGLTHPRGSRRRGTGRPEPRSSSSRRPGEAQGGLGRGVRAAPRREAPGPLRRVDPWLAPSRARPGPRSLARCLPRAARRQSPTRRWARTRIPAELDLEPPLLEVELRSTRRITSALISRSLRSRTSAWRWAA